MKTRWIQLITGLTMLVLCISVCTTTANATVVWSDDFSDGNYDGWTICNNEAMGNKYPDSGFNGSKWSATNGYLQLDQEDYGIITHPSSIAYGTWSFDFKANETQGHFSMAEIYFISNDAPLTSDDYEDDAMSYWLHIDVDTVDETDHFVLSFGKRIFDNVTLIDYYGPEPLAGWHHFDVTRNTTGGFSVYHNHSPDPIMEGQDTEIETSELFWLWFDNWHMIDNIVVDNEVSLRDSPLWILITVGGGVAVAVIVLAIVFLRRR